MIPYLIIGLFTGAIVWIGFLIKDARKYDTAKKIRGKLAKLEEASVQYPGWMNFANKGGEYFHGCRVAFLRDTQALNEFFQPGHPGHNMLVAEVLPTLSGLMVVYTAQLTNDDLADIEEFSREKHAFLNEKRAKRLEDKVKAEEDRIKSEQETKYYAEIGRKYEARVKRIKDMVPGAARKEAERRLNSGELETDESPSNGV